MVASQRNFDMLQLEEKASHAMQVSEIYSRRPHWDRGSRRLSGSLDNWNVASWSGCVDVNKVNVVQAWTAGLARARARLEVTGLFEAQELDFMALAAEGITALFPQGKRVGAQLPQ